MRRFRRAVSGVRRIDRKRTLSAPRLRRVISACSRDHPALSAPHAPPMICHPRLRAGSGASPRTIFIFSGIRSPVCRRRRRVSAGTNFRLIRFFSRQLFYLVTKYSDRPGLRAQWSARDKRGRLFRSIRILTRMNQGIDDSRCIYR
jgi:hypothetical protein